MSTLAEKPLINVQELSKQFKVRKRTERKGLLSDLLFRETEMKRAVERVSFQIVKGEMVGYIGPNGAGKSTTIKMLTGILVPTSGAVEIGGMVPCRDRKQYTKNIGVVFGQRTQLWWDIPVYESLDLMKYIYHIPEQTFKGSLDLFSDVLEVDKFWHTPVRQLSLGQRMRADLCASLLHNPDILYLDEPTIGLDAVVKKKIRDFIQEVNRLRKTTVILTTHDMADIEKLCARVIVIDHGRILYDGALGYVKSKFGTAEIMDVTLQGQVDLAWFSERGIPVNRTENGLHIEYDRGRINSSAILGHLMELGAIKDFVIRETEIEEAIRQMYLAQGESGTEEAAQ